ncbi:MAG: ECF transporter S component, partial [Thermoflexus sp.]|nr:ECF transporter S component [Thermoflexus sp.]
MARKALTWLILLIVVVLLMALASLMTGPEGVRLQGFGWLLWVAIGAVLVYIVYFATADHPAWQIGTREVVYMAIGAALYGVFSYLFNGTVFVVPSVSQVALRPAIVFPVFFGYVFGPAVGFFTGAVGNILGDFLTGWGVFPAWDIGNGLIGLVAGLPVILGRERALNILTGLVAVVGVALSLWAMTTEIESPFFGGPLSPLMRWV